MRIQLLISMTSLLLLSNKNLVAQTLFQPFPALQHVIHLEDVTIAPPYATATAFQMALHSDGTRYIVGQLRGNVDFDPGPDELVYADDWGDPYIAIYPPNGLPVVHQFINNQSGTAAELTHVRIDEVGNAYVLGEFDADFLVVGDGLPDLMGTGDTPFVAKIDPLGVVQWAFSLAETSRVPNVVTMDINNERLLIGGNVGRFDVDFDPDPNQQALASGGSLRSPDPFIASYDLDGEFLWVRVMEQVVTGQNNDQVYAVHLLNDNQTLVAGSYCGTTDFDSSASSLLFSADHTNAFMAQYDSLGFPVWVKTLGGVGNAQARVELMTADNLSITVVGALLDEIDFDPDPVNSYLLSSMPSNELDRYVAKYTLTGDWLWSHMIDTTDAITWGDVAVSINGTIAMTGTSSNFNGGLVDFDPGPANSGNTSGGFIAMYESNGDYLSAKSFGQGLGVYLSDVLWQDAVTVAAVGRFNEVFDVDPSLNTYNLSPSTPTGHEIFMASWSDVIFSNGFQ